MRPLLVAALLAGCASTEEHPSMPRAGAEARPAVAIPPSTAAVANPPPLADPTANTMAQPPAARSCLTTFTIGHGRSVLDEQRERGGAARWDDVPTRLRAAYLEPETQHPVRLVEHLQVGKTPLLWFTADFREAVVNAAVLTDLTVVDAPRLREHERVRVGTLTELGLGLIEGRVLLRFLLEAEVVRTYWHIGSTVCLLDERSDDRGYRAELSGEHVYFTNEENRDPFGLVVTIDEAGVIMVEGIAAVPFTSGPSAGG